MEFTSIYISRTLLSLEMSTVWHLNQGDYKHFFYVSTSHFRTTKNNYQFESLILLPSEHLVVTLCNPHKEYMKDKMLENVPLVPSKNCYKHFELD